MQIDIDFDVYKALTILRQSETDTYNHVLRRLLGLPTSLDRESMNKLGIMGIGARGDKIEREAGAAQEKPDFLDRIAAALKGGTSFNGVWFPEGTKFRATYKGQSYHASIAGGRWTDQNGMTHSSPSAAASAISQTNVNGWRFWYAMLPGEQEWRLLDSLKS